jgi:hypothetical protein
MEIELIGSCSLFLAVEIWIVLEKNAVSLLVMPSSSKGLTQSKDIATNFLTDQMIHQK